MERQLLFLVILPVSAKCASLPLQWSPSSTNAIDFIGPTEGWALCIYMMKVEVPSCLYNHIAVHTRYATVHTSYMYYEILNEQMDENNSMYKHKDVRSSFLDVFGVGDKPLPYIKLWIKRLSYHEILLSF